MGGQGAQGRWVLAVLFLQLRTPCSASRRASAPSSGRPPKDREQQGTGIATPDKLPVITGDRIQTPA